ncbi:cytochrome c oxidase subunit CcoM [Marinobacter caseinilyticus]|uniref:cytochrome c oxidase subunit CcoM n=1 Tax=Marinobacter caseinilyticus TaxID=2692195 RepID=UPI00140CBDF9
MYMDAVVIAGIGTVILMLAFFGSVGYFVYKDAQKPKKTYGNMTGARVTSPAKDHRLLFSGRFRL